MFELGAPRVVASPCVVMVTLLAGEMCQQFFCPRDSGPGAQRSVKCVVNVVNIVWLFLRARMVFVVVLCSCAMLQETRHMLPLVGYATS